MYDSKQSLPPVVRVPEVSTNGTKTNKKNVILTSWASVATALLLVVLIGGAFYTADLKSRECSKNNDSTDHKTNDYTKTIDKDGEKTEEDFHVDKTDQTELIVKKNDNGDITMVTAIDYKRKLSATYIPAAGQCLLLAGIDMDWSDDMEIEKTITLRDEELEEEDYKVSGNKVTDLSLLPKTLRPFCKGKPIYWLQPGEADSEEEPDNETSVGREKRGLACGCWCKRCIYRCVPPYPGCPYCRWILQCYFYSITWPCGAVCPRY